jgi:predicted MFS family arabinose efflux permease
VNKSDPQDSAAPPQRSRASSSPATRYVWYVIGLLSLVNVVNYMDRMALAVMAPLIKADMQLSDAQLGLLTGFAFALFYALCGIPIARWADRGVRRNVIALALTTWSVMTALSGLAQNFWHLLLARVGVGAGEAGSFAPAASVLCDYVPLQRRAGALGIHAFGNAAGILAGMALAGWLGAIVGWRCAFLVLGVPGVVLAIVVRVTLREPKRGFFDIDADAERAPALIETVRCLWRCHTYRWLMLYFMTNGFISYGMYQWWPSFYTRAFGATVASVGIYLGLAIGACTGLGAVMGGLVANWTARRSIRLPLLMGAAAVSLTAPLTIGALYVSSMTTSIILVSLTGLFSGVAHGPVLASSYSVVSAQMRATAGSITIFLTSAIGFGSGPFVIGVLSDALMPSLGAESLRYALLAPLLLLPATIAALLLAARTLASDMRPARTPAGQSAPVFPRGALQRAACESIDLRQRSTYGETT